ncbi:MAG: hypothetical protein IJ752_04130 [Alphaproteobacteria bacterium]|nr:hypothetical protein [Alphaproteobacteria bacterium]
MLLLVFSVAALTGCHNEDVEIDGDGSEAAAAEQSLKGCWTCSMFQTAFEAANNMTRTIVPTVARSAVSLVAVGYGLWLAIFILKQISSMQEPDAGEFWKALAVQSFWAAMGAALLRDLAGGGLGSALTSFAEPVFTGFVDAGLTVVSSSGTNIPCGPTGNAETSMLCLVRALQEKLNFGTGISLLAIMSPTGFIAIFVALIVFIVSTIMMVWFPILLLDCVFRYGMAVSMLPLAVTAYVFKPTRNFTGKVATAFMEIGFAVMGMCAFSACSVQIMGAYIDRFLPFVQNPLFFLTNLEALEQVLCGPGITGLLFLSFFLILFAEVIFDFMNALSGGVGGIGGGVRGAVAGLKATKNGAKKIANFGINRVQRMKDRRAARDMAKHQAAYNADVAKHNGGGNTNSGTLQNASGNGSGNSNNSNASGGNSGNSNNSNASGGNSGNNTNNSNNSGNSNNSNASGGNSGNSNNSNASGGNSGNSNNSNNSGGNSGNSNNSNNSGGNSGNSNNSNSSDGNSGGASNSAEAAAGRLQDRGYLNQDANGSGDNSGNSNNSNNSGGNNGGNNSSGADSNNGNDSSNNAGSNNSNGNSNPPSYHELSDEGKKYMRAAERLQDRGYLAQGADGKMHATQAYDQLMRRPTGPFKGIKRLAMGLENLKQDYSESAMEQSAARHRHGIDDGGNPENVLSSRDAAYDADNPNKNVLKEGDFNPDVVLPEK